MIQRNSECKNDESISSYQLDQKALAAVLQARELYKQAIEISKQSYTNYQAALVYQENNTHYFNALNAMKDYLLKLYACVDASENVCVVANLRMSTAKQISPEIYQQAINDFNKYQSIYKINMKKLEVSKITVNAFEQKIALKFLKWIRRDSIIESAPYALRFFSNDTKIAASISVNHPIITSKKT